MFFVVSFQLGTGGLESDDEVYGTSVSVEREAYLNEFDGDEFEAAVFESADDFADETSLNTVVFDHDEGVLACVGHRCFSVAVKLEDLERQSMETWVRAAVLLGYCERITAEPEIDCLGIYISVYSADVFIDSAMQISVSRAISWMEKFSADTRRVTMVSRQICLLI